MTLFSVDDIPIKLSLSFAFVFFYVFYILSSNLFPTWIPTASTGVTIGASFIATVLFFGSIVAHELGHTSVAKHYGLAVKDIRLFFLGGVANMTSFPKTGYQSAMIAVAGPLVSLSLSAIFFLISISFDPVSGVVGSSTLFLVVSTCAYYLGLANLAIALFNLIPAYPMDGGRILHGLLWSYSNRTSGLETALTVSNILLVVGVGYSALSLSGIISAVINPVFLLFICVGLYLYNRNLGSKLKQGMV